MALGPRSPFGAGRPRALTGLKSTVAFGALLGRAVSATLAGGLIAPTPVFKTGQSVGSVITALKGVPFGAKLSLSDSAGGAVDLAGTNLIVTAGTPTSAQAFPVTVQFTLGALTGSATIVLVAATTAEAVSYFSRMTTKPAAGVVASLDKMIATLRASTAWAKFDWFYFTAQDTYQANLVNLVGPHGLTITGSPVFAARGGITGAANASLSNGVPLNSGTFANYTLNSAHVGVFITQASASTTAIVGTDTDFTVQLLPKSGSGNFGAKVNTGTTTAVAVTSRAGHFCASRTAANANALYQNGGAAIATSANAPTALPASPLYVFRDAGNYATDQVGAFHGGAGLTQAENQTVYNALSTAISEIAALGAAPAVSTTDFDLVVYGATLAGLMTAQRAANRGARVAIVEPTAEIGGVAHHGLSYFDLGLRGSYLLANAGTDRFFKAINAAYGQAAPLTPAQKAEPKVYDGVFSTTLTQTRATVILSSPLSGPADVRKAGDAITAIRTASGWVTGRQFADCSYEGDLFAYAGAPFAIGREGAAAYNEPAGGFYAKRVADGGFNYSTDGVSPNNLYPVKAKPTLANGAGDGLIQPISFRFPISTASDRLAFPVPPGGYVASKMDQVVAMLLAKNVQQFTSVLYVGGDTALQNNKFCINASQSNLFPTLELAGIQGGYPNGTAAERQAIIDEIKSWTLHLLYCLQNDTRLSSALRTASAAYGLCSDEFVNNPIPGFPNLPYIREARRLKGQYVVTQNDVYFATSANNASNGTRNNTKADRVAQWNYILDSHAMAYYADGTNNIVITGNVDPKYQEVDTWDVPYAALHTDPGAAGHVSNLTVPLNFSASSIGWMTARLEPNFAQLGEAAGEAAMLAAEYGIDIAAVPYDRLSRRIGSPICTGLPTITGTAQVNQAMTVSNGMWLYSPKTYAYAWKDGPTTVATTQSYTPAAADAGRTVRPYVTATNGNSSAVAIGPPVTIAAA